MDQQEAARKALAESFRRERTQLDAAERANPPKEWPKWLPRGRALGWSIAILALALVAVPLVIVGGHLMQSFQIADTVRQFCAAEGGQDYTAAYGYLSADDKARTSLQEFTTLSKASSIIACSLDQKVIWAEVRDNHVAIRVSFVIPSDDSGDTQSADGTITLVNEGGSWRIDTASTPNGDIVSSPNG
jgi:hypothetical protein